jgi:hypothetical protein
MSLLVLHMIRLPSHEPDQNWQPLYEEDGGGFISVRFWFSDTYSVGNSSRNDLFD